MKWLIKDILLDFKWDKWDCNLSLSFYSNNEYIIPIVNEILIFTLSNLKNNYEILGLVFEIWIQYSYKTST